METKQIDVTITYLSQKERPPYQNYGAPHGRYSIVRCENPPLHYYRYLFDLIGAPYFWSTRRYMNDEELLSIIHHDDIYIYVLYIDGAPAGLCELDARPETVAEDMVQLRFFGLRPDCIGQNFGRWFLSNAIQLA